MRNKLIDILTSYDLGILDALTITEVMEGCLYIVAETRERMMDVMLILMKYDEENEDFLNNVRITLDAWRNRIEFINVIHEV